MWSSFAASSVFSSRTLVGTSLGLKGSRFLELCPFDLEVLVLISLADAPTASNRDPKLPKRSQAIAVGNGAHDLDHMAMINEAHEVVE